MRVIVTTILEQELEVPEGWEREDVYDFLGEYQSFRDAFQGISNPGKTARIQDIVVVKEEVIELGEVAYDD